MNSPHTAATNVEFLWDPRQPYYKAPLLNRRPKHEQFFNVISDAVKRQAYTVISAMAPVQNQTGPILNTFITEMEWPQVLTYLMYHPCSSLTSDLYATHQSVHS